MGGSRPSRIESSGGIGRGWRLMGKFGIRGERRKMVRGRWRRLHGFDRVRCAAFPHLASPSFFFLSSRFPQSNDSLRSLNALWVPPLGKGGGGTKPTNQPQRGRSVQDSKRPTPAIKDFGWDVIFLFFLLYLYK